MQKYRVNQAGENSDGRKGLLQPRVEEVIIFKTGFRGASKEVKIEMDSKNLLINELKRQTGN